MAIIKGSVIGGGGGGEANTATNVGAAGVGVFKQKVGVDLELNSINAASTNITVELDAANNEIDIDLSPNPILTGTDSLQIAGGTAAQRNGTPLEGMLRKNTDTNVIEYYDGTVWKDLTASAGTGAWTFVSSSAAAASATLDFTNLSPTKTYMFVLEDIVAATDAVSFTSRTSTDNGSTWDAGASDYSYGNSAWTMNGGAASPGGAIASTRCNLTKSGGTDGVGNAAGEKIDGVIHLINPGGTGTTSWQWDITYNDPTGDTQWCRGAGRRNAAADVDGFRLFFSAGNITSGTVRVYELAQS